jgi:hypothetical protein
MAHTASIGKPGEAKPVDAAMRVRRIVENRLPGAQILRVEPFRADAAASSAGDTAKSGGYGVPLRIDLVAQGKPLTLVLHAASANEFGHDRRADRADEMLLAADTFDSIPNHVSVLDVGAYRGSDEFVSLAGTGEFYLLTTYAEGRPYASDLRRLSRTGMVTELDIARMHALVGYLAKLHAVKPKPSRAVYARSIRDTVGGGEGVFGIADSYPDGVPGAPVARLERIEELCLSWRFRLRRRSDRLTRIHGDFHPFNVLFGENTELSVLDASRGSAGDPADDVSAMAINFAFFALGRPGSWRDVLQSFWYGFWSHYARLTGDEGVFEVAAPFLAWRALVLANPKWYPELDGSERQRILAFAERVLESERLSPAMADEYFDS